MQTVWDWLTIAVFAGLIVVFLQRSIDEQGPRDSIISYAPPAIGCAVVNQLGNKGYEPFALAGLAAILVYIWYIIDPLNRRAR